jgi:hypothetical protein
MKLSTILVTGPSGLIGSEVVKRCSADADVPVFAIESLEPIWFLFLNPTRPVCSALGLQRATVRRSRKRV